MATTPVTNFGKVQVSIGYDAAATSIALISGHGSRLPSTFPYPLTWWNATDYSDPADDPNVEIVRVEVRTGDTLSTIVRGQEGTSASVKNLSSKTYKMVLGITKAMWDGLGDLSLAETFRGLQLQIHQDAGTDLSHVQLLHADAIVMSDGEEVQDWDNLDFNIAAAVGIGGLDAGTENASSWYKIHAMWNGTTQGLMGQLAKQYTLDATYTSGEDASQGLRSNVDNSTVKISQKLIFANAGPLEFIEVKLLKTGTPSGTYWFTLEANNAGVPSNTPLATSDKYNANRLLTTATEVRIPFRIPYSVSAATTYHLVLQGGYAVSGTNFISWRMDGSAATYADGNKLLFDLDTTTWTADTDDDMWFRTYITTNDTPLVVPAGYRSAHIGWVFNNSGSDFVRFRQVNRHWQVNGVGVEGLVINEIAAGLTLINLRNYIPPVAMLPVTFAITGTGAAVGSATIGNIVDTDIVHDTTAGLGLRLSTGTTAEVPGSFGTVILSYSALMIDGTAGSDLFIQGFDW